MGPLLSLLPLLSSVITGVVAYDARAYTFDARQQSVPPVNRAVTPETARLILANRLGLSEGAMLGQADETLIRDLNTFGGTQAPIMGSTSAGDCSAKMLLVWEGVDVPDLASASKYSTDSFTIPFAPAGLVSESFVENLLTYSSAERPTPKLCSYDFAVDGGFRGTLILHVNQCPSTKDIFSTSSELSETAFRQFIAQGAKGWGGGCITAIMRIFSESNTLAVRKTVFATLADFSILAKESNQESIMIFTSPSPSYHMLQRRPGETEIMSPKPIQRRSVKNPESGDKFPSTMMPVCYNSNKTCTEVTKQCSGHGTCYRKFVSKENSRGDCYACKCSRTVVRTNKDGTVKTIQWGGPACQKQDVSTPFFLIVSFSILLAFAVTGGIRMLFSVGMEDLPGVLGAGVAVPKSQK
ncbi:conserved hypothetical protein [Histoplasma capsulatum var. duboisii H88]|uniref:Vacuolar sorting protein Vps3844 C-terminal domain-containing protein n=2 Tax=Ajellomyces capsulatus TaxID=5037 RepID=F0UMN9_AJEC8|nr:conserved hypothetical protein [Histoplasma capsulatum H143]EGC47356.1 conserved hypothetical protein [Histoplasma capsulatum var. duboisii H88]QSS53527.1 hypothetical protein I7I53_00813 [Histoplasma capsulatum var. duboisii H88]